MHVALLANSAWLDDELTTFQQLTVGLIDEQVRLTRVMPSGVGSAPSGGDGSLLGPKLTWSESRIGAVNHRRLVRVGQRLDASGVNLIHALQSELWQPAMVIGDELDLPVVYAANAAADVKQAGRLARQLNPTRSVFAATTEPIAAELRRRTQNLVPTELIPAGVHVGRDAPEVRPPGEAPCFAVCGSGVMDDDYLALLEGIGQVVETRPEVQFFFDGQGGDQHQVWRAVQRLDLLGHVSFTPPRLGHREMLLMADALIHPQATGRSRSVTLLAMAHAVPVLAVADEHLDYLIDGETGWVHPGPDAEAWADLIERRITAPDEAAQLGRSARAWVQQHRVAADQIDRTLRLYREVCGEPLPFPG
jgi:glycosyltransferase involved in cell wall biosynthesis